MAAKRHRALIVDEDVDYARLLEKYLRDAGIDSVTCKDGDTALRLAGEVHPDIVVLAALLPVRSGFEVCAAIKANEATRDIPVMMVSTVYMGDDDKESGLAVGVNHYDVEADAILAKPVQHDDFVRRARSLLGDQTATAELARKGVPRLLVVDDDPSTMRLLQRAFAKERYDVYAAVDAAQALDIFRKDTPDIVLLDVRLPDMSGLEVCGIMKSERPGVAVVLITAYGSELIAVEAMRKNADDYLSKPLNLAETAAVVAENLRKSELCEERDRLIEQLRYSNIALMRRYDELLAAKAELEECRRRAA